MFLYFSAKNSNLSRQELSARKYKKLKNGIFSILPKARSTLTTFAYYILHCTVGLFFCVLLGNSIQANALCTNCYVLTNSIAMQEVFKKYIYCFKTIKYTNDALLGQFFVLPSWHEPLKLFCLL